MSWLLSFSYWEQHIQLTLTPESNQREDKLSKYASLETLFFKLVKSRGLSGRLFRLFMSEAQDAS